MSEQVIGVLFRAFAFLLALSAHELSHGLASDRLGDPTPRLAKRLTLNPLAHLDVAGTTVFILTSLIPGSRFAIGWAKPVPVDPRYYRNPRQGLTLVGLAGPGANFLLAFLFALPLRLNLIADTASGRVLATFLLMNVFVNIGLGVFNLLPVPPLDGSKVLAGLIPLRQARWLRQIESYGPFLLLLLLLTDVVNLFLRPVFSVLLWLVLGTRGW